MTLLTGLLVLQLFRCEDRPQKLTGFVLAGIFLGVAGLARPNILMLGPALLIWIWWILKPQLGALAEAGRLEEAIQSLRHSLELNPSNIDVPEAIRVVQAAAESR